MSVQGWLPRIAYVRLGYASPRNPCHLDSIEGASGSGHAFAGLCVCALVVAWVSAGSIFLALPQSPG